MSERHPTYNRATPVAGHTDPDAARSQYLRDGLETFFDWSTDLDILLYWSWASGLAVLAFLKVLLWP